MHELSVSGKQGTQHTIDNYKTVTTTKVEFFCPLTRDLYNNYVFKFFSYYFCQICCNNSVFSLIAIMLRNALSNFTIKISN